ncbi:DUF2085 domain-containing protein [Lachnospiraceae bacterium ZAX-1]
MKIFTYEHLMCLGRHSGCHQMPDRCFSIKGKQFPICARCTGVLLGDIAAYAMFFMYIPPSWLCFVGCIIIFTDWLIQYLGIHMSTNIRRLITGIIGGYALSTLYCMAIKYAISLLAA